MDDARKFTRKEIFLAWWQAARPPFYVATLIPLFLGFIAAGKATAQWDWLIFSGVLAVCFAQHLCANLANDLFDHLAGTDNEGTIGGSGVLKDGRISVRVMAVVLAALYIFTLALALIGWLLTGLHLLWAIIVFAMLSSYFYVAPPVRYGYRALGELLVFLNMGLVMVTGTYYALTGAWSGGVAALALPVGLMVAGILYYQSLPEIKTDLASGKLTLAGLLGPEKAVFLFKLWWPAIWVLLLNLWLCGICAWPVLLAPPLCLPVHLSLCRTLDRVKDDWFSLDGKGGRVRLMYLLCGLSLLAGLYWA